MADDYSGITRDYGDTPRTVEHPSSQLNQADVASRAGRATTDTGYPDTGDLRRGYNFGKSFTKLSFKRDPFLHHMNMMRKVPTDDPRFKYTYKRKNVVFKQYGYVVGMTASGELVEADKTVTSAEAAWGDAAYVDFLEADLGHGTDTFANADIVTLGSTQSIVMMGDYKRAGNLSNVITNSTYSAGQAIELGSIGTAPKWFFPNMLVRIPCASTIAADTRRAPTGYAIARIKSVYDLSIYKTGTTTTIGEGVILNVIIVKTPDDTVPTSLMSSSTWSAADATLFDVSHGTGTSSVAQKLEPARSYNMGSAYHELSGYPGETFRETPYSTDFGLTQYFKRSALMSYRAMSTVLKFEKNPWAEEWQDKMLEISMDMGESAYWGEQYEDADGITYTEGVVNFILNNGNQFLLDINSKSQDDFLEDMSAFNDPRYAFDPGVRVHYYCNTAVWNWLGKVAGYTKTNVELSSNYSLQNEGFATIGGVKARKIVADSEVIHVMRDIHLDRSNVKMVAVDMNSTKIRPLVGNGINNDVTVYPGVVRKDNSGQSYRVDLIDADVGYEFGAPERMAVWL